MKHATKTKPTAKKSTKTKAATTSPATTPKATTWRDAERQLFGEPNHHYEMRDASTADLLRSAIGVHSGGDTITDALETAAAELCLVSCGIEGAPDINPEIVAQALGAIERRIRIVAVLASRIQNLVDLPATSDATAVQS